MIKVIAVSKNADHSFHKLNCDKIVLLEGLGIEGDAHAGVNSQHGSRNAHLPNLRQVHLMHIELFEELAQKGFSITPGLMGENITTEGIPLLSLPQDTVLHIGQQAQVKITGLRSPCHQLDERIQAGLMEALLDKDDAGNVIRKAGVMGVVLKGGTIYPGDDIRVELPALPHVPLDKV